MISSQLYSRLTCFTVSFTFLTLFTSKAGVNIAFGLILVTAVIGATSKQPLLSENTELRKASYLSFGLYALGLIVTFITPLGLTDLAWFARKGAFFLLLPFLFPMLEKHDRIAMKALLLGAVVAMGYALYLYMTKQVAGRISSFWDIGRWGEILAYLWALLLPTFYLYSFEKRGQYLALGLIGASTIIALVASGSRGPMLFAACSTLLFLLFTSRQLFLGLIFVGVISLFLMKDSAYFHSTYERIASIAASDNNSNNARLAMWRYGLGMTWEHITSNPLLFLFGTGDSELPNIFTHYLSTVGSIEEIQRSVGNQISYSDLHSLYVDNLVRMGLIYSFSYLAFIAFLLCRAIKLLRQGSSLAWGMINLITTYLGIGLVYSNNLEFQTSIFLFMLSLAWVQGIKKKEQRG
ncbi:O-antigen ligase family protein [Vibrio sp. SCSIO 43133]|uniref:O-antigen ligase family protein n=1 Tax=Vibrio sp. SCSIO 43133 TaxID=2802577 RepID=UPI002076168C|nr:O-antigen ligase family protein [Vibrio sp. SCSIO 43133]USE00347.1 O-antigen ligase family protein [Vibrio sp. SCSIO 43133]